MKKKNKAQPEEKMTLRDVQNAVLTLQLADQRRHMINYLNMKVQVQDWHAVADAAMDLREIDAKQSVLDVKTMVSK